MNSKITVSGDDLKSALIAIKNANVNLCVADIAHITDTPKKTVESWMYDNGRHPTKYALRLVVEAVIRSRGWMPREAWRIINRDKARALAWGDKNQTGNSGSIAIGDKIIKTNVCYCYRGQHLTIQQIADSCSWKYQTIYQRIKRSGFSAGSDVTAIVDVKDGRGRRAKEENQ